MELLSRAVHKRLVVDTPPLLPAETESLRLRPSAAVATVFVPNRLNCAPY
jgi:hypothetical protein